MAIKSPFRGVNVYWLGTQTGTFTDDHGKFRISGEGVADLRLVISSMGYRTDTVRVASFKGKFEVIMVAENQTLGEVEVAGRKDNTFIRSCGPRLPR